MADPRPDDIVLGPYVVDKLAGFTLACPNGKRPFHPYMLWSWHHLVKFVAGDRVGP